MTEETLSFEEGKTCPVKVNGMGGGLSFSSNGDMLLIGAFSNPSKAQMEAWEGKWKAKLHTESEFPAIPIFALDSDDWIIEAPCNPAEQEKESSGFCEALFAKEDCELVAVLVDSDTGIVKKISFIPLDEMFIERLVISWNPYRFPSNEYNKSFNEKEFSTRITEIFQTNTSKKLWTTSW